MNSSISFLGLVDHLVTVTCTGIGLFTLPWGDRKRGGPWLISQVDWSLCSVLSDGNCFISVIYRMEKVCLAYKWPLGS